MVNQCRVNASFMDMDMNMNPEIFTHNQSYNTLDAPAKESFRNHKNCRWDFLSIVES